jgi:hypothetical protein
VTLRSSYPTHSRITAGGGAIERCYPRLVREEDLVAFARRDWLAISASKRRRWADQKSRMKPAEALSAGDGLRHYARALRDRWPSEEDRRNDLASHIRVAEMLHRVKPTDRR